MRNKTNDIPLVHLSLYNRVGDSEGGYENQNLYNTRNTKLEKYSRDQCTAGVWIRRELISQ